MVLALSSGTLLILLIIIALVLCAYSINKGIKIRNRNKQKEQAMMNDLNVFMMKHEAGKRAIEEAKLDAMLDEEKSKEKAPAATIAESLKDDEKIRVKTLYEDAGMSAEDIASKTGRDIELVKAYIENGFN